MKFLPLTLGIILVSLLGISLTLANNDPTPAGTQSLLFIQNQGQFDKPIRYQIFGTPHTTWLMDDGLWYTLATDEGATSIKLTVDQPSQPTPQTALATHINYMGGTQNLTSVPVWASVTYTASGLTLSGENGQLNLSGRDIHLTLSGATILAHQGNHLQLDTALGPQTLTLPTSSDNWQLSDGTTTLTIPGRDTTTPTTPTTGGSLIYSSYIGGSFQEHGRAVAVDNNANAYVSGLTQSVDFPITLTLGLRAPAQHGVDVYVARFLEDGSYLHYMTFVNPVTGADEDHGFDIAVDTDGNAYAVGRTDSPDFCPAGTPGLDTTYGTNSDGYLFKLDPTGAYIYCTFIGGSDLDFANSVAVANDGSVFVGGGTFSTNFPTTPAGYDVTHNGLRDAFVVHFNADNTSRLYSTFIGGSNQETVRALEIDYNGNVYATGWTSSNDFDTTAGAYDTIPNGGFEGYAFQLNPAGNNLIYSTYLGGSNEDRAWALAHNRFNNTVSIVGQTTSDNFPTVNAIDNTRASGNDLFMLTLNQDGSDLLFSTYLGGNSEDVAHDIAIGTSGAYYLTGSTSSSDFPVTAGAYDTTNDNSDSFFAQISPNYELLYASYLGGTEEENGFGLALGPNGTLYLTGETRSPDYPTTPGAFDELHNSDYDIYLTKFNLTPPNNLVLTLPIIQQP